MTARRTIMMILLAAMPCLAGRAEDLAARADVAGGLVVLLGGQAELAADFEAREGWLVHVLAEDQAQAGAARARLRSRKLAHRVAVGVAGGAELPYADRAVNLLIAPAGLGQVPEAEARRVLSPLGAAVIGQDRVIRRPWPETIDEWTHFLHGPGGNAVAADREVAEPRGIQWNAPPKWNRHHGQLGGLSAMVTSRGRVFAILDEGATQHSRAPAEWVLVARDAFSGVRLWDRKIDTWHSQFRGFRTGPAWLTRRLVADGDRLFATPALDGPIVQLDAATGRTIRTYEAADHAQEFIYHEGRLYVVTGVETEQEKSWPRRGPVDLANRTALVAVDTETGKQLWKRDGEAFSIILPLSLATDGRKVVVHTQHRLYCLEAATGKERWSRPRKAFRVRPGWSTPTVVLIDDTILLADRDKPMTFRRSKKETFDKVGQDQLAWNAAPNECWGPAGTFVALDAADGSTLWTTKSAAGFSSPTDIFYAQGLVWVASVEARGDSDFQQGRDLRTGEVKRSLSTADAFPQNHHHRCYRVKATEEYIVLGRTGTELIDLDGKENDRNTWVRGTCQYGVMPANGLIYAPPHACACYPEGKLAGLWALAPRSALEAPAADEARLKRLAQARPGPEAQPTDWPVFRHDNRRTGATDAKVGKLSLAHWETAFAGRLSAPIVVGDRAYVAQVDAGAVHAVDMADGEVLWSVTVEGRVDSPPSYDRGLLYFGSADGRVYCVRAADGEKLWQFLAAPLDRRIVSNDAVESVWPVHGSVLVHAGSVWVAAGRSSYLDGGISLYRLHPLTGRILAQKQLSHAEVETGLDGEFKPGSRMIGALNDILSCGEGETVFMRHNHFDAEFGKIEPAWHIYSANGYLDDSWFSRSYWIYGMRMWGKYKGWPVSSFYVPFGRILSWDREVDRFFGYRRTRRGWGMESDNGHILYKASFQREKAFETMPAEDGFHWKKNDPETVDEQWEIKTPIWVRAMAAADDAVVIAGPILPDRRSKDAAEALAGKRGSKLMLISRADGSVITQLDLPAPPVWDGLAVVTGRALVSGNDGVLRCYGPDR
jgi:outer membrane protein assembly factor BamB